MCVKIKVLFFGLCSEPKFMRFWDDIETLRSSSWSTVSNAAVRSSRHRADGFQMLQIEQDRQTDKHAHTQRDRRDRKHNMPAFACKKINCFSVECGLAANVSGFAPFRSCDLDLDPMTWIYEFDLNIPKLKWNRDFFHSPWDTCVFVCPMPRLSDAGHKSFLRAC